MIIKEKITCNKYEYTKGKQYIPFWCKLFGCFFKNIYISLLTRESSEFVRRICKSRPCNALDNRAMIVNDKSNCNFIHI